MFGAKLFGHHSCIGQLRKWVILKTNAIGLYLALVYLGQKADISTGIIAAGE